MYSLKPMRPVIGAVYRYAPAVYREIDFATAQWLKHVLPVRRLGLNKATYGQHRRGHGYLPV